MLLFYSTVKTIVITIIFVITIVITIAIVILTKTHVITC